MLSRSVSRFVERYPDISVSIDFGMAAQQILAINRQNADRIFTYTPPLEMYPALVEVPEAVIPRALGWYRNNTSPVLERFVETVAESAEADPTE